jgi:surfeit locus 1 family protein
LSAPDQRSQRSWVGLLVPAILAFIVLVGLGTWQVERKAWKEGLIASLTERLAVAPTALPAAADWPHLDRTADEYRRVTFSAAFDYAHEAFVFAAGSAFRPEIVSPGYWVFTPARLADGVVVIVNRGFVPDGRKDPETRPDGQVAGTIALTGVLRWPDGHNWFTPNDDPAHNLWFSRDPQAIATAKGLGPVAPFFVEQEAPVPPGGLPQPGKLVVALPDNHLQYALTWYGLAAVLVGVFGAWAFSSSRKGTAAECAQKAAESPSRSL